MPVAPEVALHPYRQRCRDTGKTVDHKGDKGTVPQSGERAGFGRVQQLARLFGAQHRCLAALDDIA